MGQRGNRVPMMLSDEEVEAIDEWAGANGIATRSAAIRRLCQVALSVDADLPQVLERSREFLNGFVDMMQAVGEQFTAAIKTSDAETADRMLRVWEEVSNLFDEFTYLQLHWIETHNVVRATVEAKSIAQARKMANSERERLTALRQVIIDKRNAVIAAMQNTLKSL